MNIKPRPAFDLLLASALGLFLELVFIRWLSSEIRIFAFYKNFALIAAYLGFGLGFALSRQERQRPWFEKFYLPLLTLSVFLVLLLGRSGLSDILLANRANAQEYIGQVFWRFSRRWFRACSRCCFIFCCLPSSF